ncbi:MAG: thioredoxin family protein [Haloarculaceae archaeon]
MSTDLPDGVDPEALLDRLFDAGVLAERDDGTVVVTAGFADERDLYHQTYGDVDERQYVRAVASAFDVDREAAAERIEAHGVTREEFVAYVALQSFLDDPPGAERLAVMAGMVADLGVESPVPDGMAELTDDTYESFLDGDAAVFVWRHRCDPCEALKADLPDVLAALPDGVAVAGVDGEAASDLRRAFDVDSAPTLLLFRDGDLVESVVGRHSPDHYRTVFDEVYRA